MVNYTTEMCHIVGFIRYRGNVSFLAVACR
jgi:hypothetical protein